MVNKIPRRPECVARLDNVHGESLIQTTASNLIWHVEPYADSFVALYLADPLTRVQIVKQGVDARCVDALASVLHFSRDTLLAQLGLASATIKRRAQDGKPLSPQASERVLGVAKLIGQAQAMVQASGDATGFDAAAWVGQWLEQPLPALGGHKPAEFMDTAEGQGIVASLLERIHSSAYA